MLSNIVQAGTRQLPVSADHCAIHYALTQKTAAGCLEPSDDLLGVARNLSRPADVAPLTADETGYYIRFGFNSDALTAEYHAHLMRLSDVLKSPELAGTCLRLVGHTDVVGSERYNKSLSMARAQTVQNVLTTDGQIETKRLSIRGHGKEQLLPGMPGTDARNRRVEILARSEPETGC